MSLDSIVVDALKVIVAIIACGVSFYIGYSQRKQSSSKDMLINCYFPLFALIKSIQKPCKNGSLDEVGVEECKQQMLNVFRDSHGCFPYELYETVEALSIDNFHDICKLIEHGFYVCQARGGYVSFSPSTPKKYALFIRLRKVLALLAIPTILWFVFASTFQIESQFFWSFSVLICLVVLCVLLSLFTR